MKYRLKKILLSNWLICTMLTVGIIVGLLTNFYPFQFIEYKAFDAISHLRKFNESDKVVIVKIDDHSLREIGSTPWPRNVIADAVSRLSEFKPKVMAVQILFSGPEINPAHHEIQALRKEIREDIFPKHKKNRIKIDHLLSQTAEKLDHDANLISAVNYAVNAVLPILFTSETKEPVVSFDPLPDWLARHSIRDQRFLPRRISASAVDSLLYLGMTEEVITASTIISTYENLARKASALGHMNLSVDRDGIVRKMPLLIMHRDRYFPSFALQVASRYLKANLRDVQRSETGLSLKNMDIPTDHAFQMFIESVGFEERFQKVSFADVYLDNVSPEMFEGKIVLLGEILPGRTPYYRSAGHEELSSVELTAAAIDNIINRRHLSRPIWANVLEILVVVYFGLFLVFVIPRVKPRDGALILSIFLVTWLCFAGVLFMVFGYWLKLFAPVILTIIGFTIAGFRRFAIEKQLESIELNKMLGLSFQGKGMLDMAFEKFRKCPVQNGSVRDLLYNLGQDFERKRMFNKALAVYYHMQKAGRFRDIQQRIETLKSLGEAGKQTVVKSNGALLLDEATTRPTLGRYEIIKELGQGAMGTVYLGLDPKINREVAIKTLSYTNVDEGKLDEIKERFLREAEAAGRLSHPNIVTIYDVGEEHDMAYMAMELIQGRVLSEYCQKSNLLPVSKALGFVATVAEALEYAHTHGVVHRDIKPDNIILVNGNQVKVADFGIARVVSASQTQTGIILGTPNYMSPEQVEGLHVDGRSDLFSLGVVLYELLTGERPFKGDNVAHLMYNIAHTTYSPVNKILPDVPMCCNQIVKKLLVKDPQKRLKSAGKLVRKIEQCLQGLG